VKKDDWLLVVLVILAVFAVALLLRRFNYFVRSRNAAAEPRSYPWRYQLIALVKILIWFAFFILLLGVMFFMAGPIGFLLWLATLVIALMILIRYREMERRTLLWSLAVAAEKGIPLTSAVRAFAEERHDGLSYRARILASALEQGLPLDKALEVSSNRLPNDALVAVRTGCEVGGLAALLKKAVRHSATVDSAVHAAVARVMYLITFVFFAAGIMTFLAIKIVPAYQKIFEDFKTRLPPPTLALVKFFWIFHRQPAIAIATLTIVLLLFLFALVRYVGLVRWDPPLVRRVTLPLDESLVLRCLAESIDEHKPLDTAFLLLAKQYPKGYIRRRLRRAAKRTAEGTQWCDSLVADQLLTPADAGVLKAAERVGNLSWAMDYTADRLVRRFTTRLWAIVSVGFPIALLVFGAFVLWIAVGFFFPLVKLIHDLA
jgi:type II secretory pathway component PulF